MQQVTGKEYDEFVKKLIGRGETPYANYWGGPNGTIWGILWGNSYKGKKFDLDGHHEKESFFALIKEKGIENWEKAFFFHSFKDSGSPPVYCISFLDGREEVRNYSYNDGQKVWMGGEISSRPFKPELWLATTS